MNLTAGQMTKLETLTLAQAEKLIKLFYSPVDVQCRYGELIQLYSAKMPLYFSSHHIVFKDKNQAFLVGVNRGGTPFAKIAKLLLLSPTSASYHGKTVLKSELLDGFNCILFGL